MSEQTNTQVTETWARKMLMECGYPEETLSDMSDEDCEVEVSYLED
ncbi:hypothetical protein [Tumebacillus lipolyticus]|uniref:Uncharacterized protein n=1 Tax=Tumebacillus lipolyticus TaxID=1280370 RepID=A0ABW5A3J2_9BACL